jgi:hypothetical protein
MLFKVRYGTEARALLRALRPLRFRSWSHDGRSSSDCCDSLALASDAHFLSVRGAAVIRDPFGPNGCRSLVLAKQMSNIYPQKKLSHAQATAAQLRPRCGAQVPPRRIHQCRVVPVRAANPYRCDRPRVAAGCEWSRATRHARGRV